MNTLHTRLGVMTASKGEMHHKEAWGGHWGETDWLDTKVRENNGKKNDNDYMCDY